MWISKINVAYFHSEMYCWHSFKEIFLVHLRSMFENGRLYTGPCQSCQQYIYRMFELLWRKVWKDWWRTYCLLGPQVEVVRIVIDVGVARVKSLVLLLLCHLLNRKKPVFPHLYSLGHVAHTCIFWNRGSVTYHHHVKPILQSKVNGIVNRSTRLSAPKPKLVLKCRDFPREVFLVVYIRGHSQGK